MHPKVHAGILSTDSASDERDLAEQSIEKVDFVVCNLYPCESPTLWNLIKRRVEGGLNSVGQRGVLRWWTLRFLVLWMGL